MDSRFSALLLILFRLAILHYYPSVIKGLNALVPASFVLGDSLVDAGNNNYIVTLSKANTPPNGIDFPGGQPTGRFTNGRTVVDIIGEHFDLPFAPPYLAPSTTGAAILKGVNYASGGAGILDDTGRIFIGRIPLWQQIRNFENTTVELRSMLGDEVAANLLAKSFVSVTIGSNDYLNNYVSPVPLTRDVVLAPQQYQDNLISTFRLQLTTIYNLGARKIVLSNVGPVGCIPYQLTLNPSTGGSCVTRTNLLVSSFNSAVKDMVMELSTELPGASIVVGDSYKAVSEVLSNPQSYGFDTSNHACCGAGGPYQGLIPCSPDFILCPDRSRSFFWDPYHPSDASNAIIADRFVNGNSDYITPFNLKQLAAL